MDAKDQMVTIPNGNIALRDDGKKVKRNVDIQSFELSKYLVTQDFYSQIISFEPSLFSGANKPVESVSWIDAILFCNTLSTMEDLENSYLINLDTETVELLKKARGYRLPTDAEWEYSCRAG